MGKRFSKSINRGFIGAAAMAVLAGPAAAQSNETLQQKVATLEARVAELETESESGLKIAPGTTLTFYGYAKADLLFDQDYDLGNTIFGLANLNAATPAGSAFTGHAFQSRLGFTTSTNTSHGPLTTKVEGDFFGGGGGQFRLRHAYGEYAGFLAGQTWTNWMPIESYPGTLDFQGPAGIPFARQNQFRYTFGFGEGLSASFSVENDPSSSSDRAAITAAASYRFSHGMGDSFVKLAAVSRELSTPTGTEDAYGVNLSGNTSLWQGGSLQVALTTGEGIGSYMVFGGPDVDSAGKAIETDGITIGLTQAINDKLALGLAYGKREIDRYAGALATDTSELETVHFNVTYKPVERVTLGLEYITGERTEFGGASFDADRIQASAQFNF